MVWHRELEKLGGMIAQLRIDVAARQAELQLILSETATQSTALKDGIADLQRLEGQISQGEIALNNLDGEIDRAKQALDGLALNCGGASYKACTDLRRKQDYDRAQYEAQQVLLRLREQRATSRAEVQSYRAARRGVSATVNAATAALIKAGARETKARLVLARQTRELGDATQKYDAEYPTNAAYSAANATELTVVEKLLAIVAGS